MRHSCKLVVRKEASGMRQDVLVLTTCLGKNGKPHIEADLIGWSCRPVTGRQKEMTLDLGYLILAAGHESSGAGTNKLIQIRHLTKKR